MERITLELDLRTKAGKALKHIIEEMAAQTKGVKLLKSPYDPEFIKMVKDAAAEKGGRVADPRNPWPNTPSS